MINIIENKKIKLSETEYQIYSNQLKIEDLGIKGQEKIKKTRALVIGAGGLGCIIIMYLAISGFGTIGLIDGDRVEYSNLNRQILYDITDIKEFKVIAAKKKLMLYEQIAT